MRITRLVAGAVTAGLLGITPLAISAPAEAATTYTTQSTLETLTPVITYGEDLTFNGAVTTTEGGSVWYGTATLYAAPATNPTAWTAVEADETAGNYFFWDIKPLQTTLYKVVYSGTSSTNGDVWTPSESPVLTVQVARKITLKNPRGTFIKGKVGPEYAKKKVIVQKKVGKSWRKFRVLKTNSKGAFTTTLPAYRKRTNWLFVAKGDAEFAVAAAGGWTVRSRPLAGRAAVS